MAPQRTQVFLAYDSTSKKARLPYTKWNLTSGNKYIETVELKPKASLTKHSQYFAFSLKPPMPGADKAEHPDFFRCQFHNSPANMKPVKYTGEWRGNVGGEETGENTARADWYRSTLEIKLNKKYLNLSDNISVTDGERYKRGLFVADF